MKLNQVIIAGNLTRDVELRYTPQGTAVTDIGIAVNDRVKRGEQWEDEVTFVDVTIWGRQAEIANEYCQKGSAVLITGRLKLDEWEKDGQKRTKLKVVCNDFQMVGKGKGANSGQASQESVAPAAYAPPQHPANQAYQQPPVAPSPYPALQGQVAGQSPVPVNPFAAQQ